MKSKFKLWREYFNVAYQYWLPANKVNSKLFYGYIILLLCFLTAALFFTITGFSFLSTILPESVQQIVVGFSTKIVNLFNSNWKYIFLGMFIIPGILFLTTFKKVKANLIAWTLLGFLLLLSL